MFRVLDFYGLTPEQEEQVSVVLGGSAREVIGVTAMPQLHELERVRVHAVVARWGDERIGQIMALLNPSHQTFKGQYSYRLIGVIGHRAYLFHVMDKVLPQWDEDADEFVEKAFKPSEYYQGYVIELPWDHDEAAKILDVTEEQGIQGHMLYGEAGDCVFRFEFGQYFETLEEGGTRVRLG